MHVYKVQCFQLVHNIRLLKRYSSPKNENYPMIYSQPIHCHYKAWKIQDICLLYNYCIHLKEGSHIHLGWLEIGQIGQGVTVVWAKLILLTELFYPQGPGQDTVCGRSVVKLHRTGLIYYSVAISSTLLTLWKFYLSTAVSGRFQWIPSTNITICFLFLHYLLQVSVHFNIFLLYLYFSSTSLPIHHPWPDPPH